MTETKREFPKGPWAGWRPGAGRKYDPSDSHFNPLHPPEGYPREELEKEWGETFDNGSIDNTTRETICD